MEKNKRILLYYWIKLICVVWTINTLFYILNIKFELGLIFICVGIAGFIHGINRSLIEVKEEIEKIDKLDNNFSFNIF